MHIGSRVNATVYIFNKGIVRFLDLATTARLCLLVRQMGHWVPLFVVLATGSFHYEGPTTDMACSFQGKTGIQSLPMLPYLSLPVACK